tara:strand:+ start:128 stop:598 length:471 start_codon:yes stop_codon:yes gene_type:complete
MSNTGARAFYLVLDTVKDTLLNDVDINTVTYGDLSEVDLSKQTIFPLAHVLINGATLTDQTVDMNLTVLCMDSVDIYKNESKDPFAKNESEHQILNTMLAVGNRLTQKFMNGTLHQDGFQMDGDVTCEVFFDRFEGQLAGWAFTFTVSVHNDIYKC